MTLKYQLIKPTQIHIKLFYCVLVLSVYPTRCIIQRKKKKIENKNYFM